MGNRVVRHNKFFKVLTICGASLGLLASSTFSILLGLDMNGHNKFITNELRQYTAKFVNEGSLISEATYARGEEIEKPENPSHEIDGENNYIFIGWDTTGNGLPDVVPTRIYYSFTANAVYLSTGKFDLSFLDLTNMDLETLLKLLETLNIDWEQFMDMFNIDPETLMEWLSKNAVLTFEADESRYLAYFRSTSYGDYNYSKKKFNAPDYYDSSNISTDSINPLSYTADKVHNAYSISGTLPPTFNFVNYDITFKSKQDYYPVPDCEYTEYSDNFIDSDAHYLKKPIDNQYSTYAAYVPAMNNVIELLSLVPFSNGSITSDERNYYKYALEKYTSIPKEYESVIDGIIKENDWYERDYGQVNSIGAYVENLGSCSIFKDGEINLNYKKNKDPVMGLIENKEGSDLDFNVTAMMIFRRLEIPARIVKGYLAPSIQQGYNEITLLQQHYWCEIYVKNIGWMICDCMNAEEFLGTNPYGDLDKKSNPLEMDKYLERIEVTAPEKTEYYQYESPDRSGMVITAYYSDGSVADIPSYKCQIEGFDTNEIGTKTVTVTYEENTFVASDDFEITVIERPNTVDRVEFNVDEVKKEFYVGQTFESKGLKCTVYYVDGTEADISNLERVDSSMVNMNYPGNYSVYAYVILEDHTYPYEYPVTVLEDTPESIEVTKKPTKLKYFVGDSLDPTGIEVTMTTQTGKKSILKNDQLSYSPGVFSFDSAYTYPREQDVTVEYYTYDRYYNLNVLRTTFEVTVEINEVESIRLENYKDEYTLGDSFILDEFKEEEFKVYIKYATGGEVEVDPSLITFVTPDLSTAGDSHVTVKYTENGDTTSQDIPIQVSALDEKEFSVSPKVSTAGPGDSLVAKDLFKYNSLHYGTMYFRNASYSTYESGHGWSNVETPKQYAISPNGLTYDKIKQLYYSSQVTITYLEDIEHGVSPVYGNLNGFYYDEYLLEGNATAGSSKQFDFATADVTYDNFDYLSNTNYFKYTTENLRNVGSSYNTNEDLNGIYLQDTSPYETQMMIEQFINSKGYNSLDTLSKIQAVKSDLQDPNQFTYDINFKYDASQDPIYSFFTTRKGICNNFASAATMIYRHLGIPARFVVGFGSSTTGGDVTVTTNDAHAWTEVYIQNIGWVVVDATGYSDGRGTSGGYYGSGFGGSSNGGLYNASKIFYSGNVFVTYQCGSSTGYDFQITYDGNTHGASVASVNPEYGSFPTYLEVTASIVEGGSSEVGSYVYYAQLSVRDKITGNYLASYEHGYTIHPSTSSCSMTILPQVVYINISLTGNTSLSESSGTVVLTPTQTKYYLSGGDYIEVGGSATFTEVGTYYSYGGITLSFGSGNSDNYIVIPLFESVEIVP